MSNNHTSLLKRINKMFDMIEQRRSGTRPRVIIYDPATGEPLPGYEPNERALAQVWLPKKAIATLGDI
jgi:hypothetical protein